MNILLIKPSSQTAGTNNAPKIPVAKEIVRFAAVPRQNVYGLIGAGQQISVLFLLCCAFQVSSELSEMGFICYRVSPVLEVPKSYGIDFPISGPWKVLKSAVGLGKSWNCK